MILRRVLTTTTTARRAPTTINRVRRKICRAPIVEQPRRRSGDVTCVARWCVTLAACTSNCTVSIGHIRCVATQFTHADVVQRETSRTEEVSWRRFSDDSKLIFYSFAHPESKNQESPEQEANGGSKSDLTAIQNHNLLIALAQHSGTSGAAQFAMPVSVFLMN